MKLTHSNSSSTLDFNSFQTDKESSGVGAGRERWREGERCNLTKRDIQIEKYLWTFISSKAQYNYYIDNQTDKVLLNRCLLVIDLTGLQSVQLTANQVICILDAKKS